MNQATLFELPATPRVSDRVFKAHEWKVLSLRECSAPPVPCDCPELAANYWRENIRTHPYFNPDVECLVVLMLNTRRRLIGHHLVSTGTLDTILVHPREVYRCAVIAAAAAIILMHNHPSGDPSPSDADIRVTRDLIRAGQTMKLELTDHIVMGEASPERPRGYHSLRELGYFHA
jgi:DNA repair protein RadC